MRSTYLSGLLVFLGIALPVGVEIVACSTPNDNVTNIPPLMSDDASVDANGDVATSTLVDTSIPPPDEASVTNCALSDGSDPVGLCIQKLILRAQHQVAFSVTNGVAASWDSTTFAPDATPHDFHDDVSYASSCALYHTNSQLYGDADLTPTLDDDLAAISPLIVLELTPLPVEYDGALYTHLRNASAGLRYINENDDATSIDTVADAYGRAIYATYFRVLSGSVNTSDAGAVDGGGVDGVFGTSAGGLVTYSTADVATAALALLDLANRNATTDPTSAAEWQIAAMAALDHIRTRGRDPITNLYYRTLTTTAGATSDTLAGATPTDFISTDVQAEIALALSRAQDLVTNNPTALALAANYPFQAHATEIVDALNGLKIGASDASLGAVTLWDATNTGYLTGYTPSTHTLTNDKSTHANAFLLAVIHRSDFADPTVEPSQVAPLRALLLNTTPTNSSFLTVVPSQNGYFEAVSKTFQLVTDGSTIVPAKSYSSAAIAAAVEGLTEELYPRQ